MSEKRWTLQEMCEAFDVTPRTLRYYEYIELLAPDRDADNPRRRLYSSRERARLTLILRGRRFGFQLEEIRQWLNLYDEGEDADHQYREWIDLSTRQIAELRTQQQELEEAIAELERLRTVAREAIGRES